MINKKIEGEIKMPNIELHGFKKDRAEALRRNIFQVFGGYLFVKEMVVTIFPTDVEDMDGKKQPFIRLVNPAGMGMDRERALLDGLRVLGIDVEHLYLKQFYPKKE